MEHRDPDQVIAPNALGQKVSNFPSIEAQSGKFRFSPFGQDFFGLLWTHLKPKI